VDVVDVLAVHVVGVYWRAQRSGSNERAVGGLVGKRRDLATRRYVFHYLRVTSILMRSITLCSAIATFAMANTETDAALRHDSIQPFAVRVPLLPLMGTATKYVVAVISFVVGMFVRVMLCMMLNVVVV